MLLLAGAVSRTTAAARASAAATFINWCEYGLNYARPPVLLHRRHSGRAVRAAFLAVIIALR